MSVSLKPRHEIFSAPQTWLGRMLNAEEDDDARNEVLKYLTSKETMRLHLLSKKTLIASTFALDAHAEKLLSVYMNKFNEEYTRWRTLRDAGKHITQAHERNEIFEIITIMREKETAQMQMENVVRSILYLNYWRLLLETSRLQRELLEATGKARL